ncbi:testis-expressed protein 12 [Manis javanica]|uniref:testis-expressed protein 12 n=1 Tax=Manis javanica TaxID=9974 RepID=UPI00187AC6E8|nr:testis-expressed protein 12 isoform X2 [Manis javanica]
MSPPPPPHTCAQRRFPSHDDCPLRGRAGGAHGPSRDARAARWELACLPPPQRVLRPRTRGVSVPAPPLTRSSCLRRVMAGHLVKPDARNCKRPRDLEPQMPDSPQLSSLGKSDSSFSESSGLFYKDEALEKDLNDLSKEINLMLSTYAKILSERAAVDASYIVEIDGLFKEASAIENFLIQKRELLRQRFTVIANTLHN